MSTVRGKIKKSLQPSIFSSHVCIYTEVAVPSFKFKFSLGFVTSCYVSFSLSMVQAMDILMITSQDVLQNREETVT